VDEEYSDEVTLYLQHANEMLEVAKMNLANDFYASTVNRAYYAVFYAANAMLATEGLARSKHSGVISLFRQTFVKPGKMSQELSDIYGRIMDDRQLGDYDLGMDVDAERARQDLADAVRFVADVSQYLTQGGWL
jgi:uncharacterized protein (UPF0332 family)